MKNTPRQNFNMIQDECNPLNLKARLITKWVDREVLDVFIEKYEKAIVWILYPVIVD